MSRQRQEYKFIFFPRLPTEEAEKNKPFHSFPTVAAFFAGIRELSIESIRSIGSIGSSGSSGHIHFKVGHYSYDKGTVPIVNNPKWWESGQKSCVRGCCTVPLVQHPVFKKPVQRPLWLKRWQDFHNIDDLESQFSEIENKDSIWRIVFKDIGFFTLVAYQL